MDENDSTQFKLDTSILVPVAIAGGVALAIVVLVYCCRHLIFRKGLRNTTMTSVLERNRMDEDTRHVGRRGGGSISEAIRHQFIPWSSREHYLPATARGRPNYHSTQVNNEYSLSLFSFTCPVLL